MPTVPESLQKAQDVIKESTELLLSCHKHKDEIQAQLDASRKAIDESWAIIKVPTPNASE